MIRQNLQLIQKYTPKNKYFTLDKCYQMTKKDDFEFKESEFKAKCNNG